MIQARAQPVSLFCPGLHSLESADRLSAHFAMSMAGALWGREVAEFGRGCPARPMGSERTSQCHVFSPSWGMNNRELRSGRSRGEMKDTHLVLQRKRAAQSRDLACPGSHSQCRAVCSPELCSAHVALTCVSVLSHRPSQGHGSACLFNPVAFPTVGKEGSHYYPLGSGPGLQTPLSWLWESEWGGFWWPTVNLLPPCKSHRIPLLRPWLSKNQGSGAPILHYQVQALWS